MKKLIFSLLAIAMAFGVNAQKIKTTDGSPEILKGQKNVAIIFTYEDLTVGKMSETDYVKREVKERNDKEAGTGVKWKEAWLKDQQERYPAKFVELFNKIASEKFDCTVKKDAPDSKYTIKVHTTFIEPGFNVGVMRRPALVDQTISIYETANPDKILHELTIAKSPGNGAMGYDFDAGFRIAEGFAKAGKEYAYFCYKKHIK